MGRAGSQPRRSGLFGGAAVWTTAATRSGRAGERSAERRRMEPQFTQQVTAILRALWKEHHPHGIDSKDVCDALIAQGIPVPEGALPAILAELQSRALIRGVEYGS